MGIKSIINYLWLLTYAPLLLNIHVHHNYYPYLMRCSEVHVDHNMKNKKYYIVGTKTWKDFKNLNMCTT